MAKCAWCRKKFDVADTKEEYDSKYGGAGEYEGDYPNVKICFECASRETDGNIAEGEEIIELMGSHDWESDD